MDSTVLFESIIYRKELPEYVDNINKITNDYLHKARKQAKEGIYEREKKYGVKIGDHGMSYHSHGKLYQDKRLAAFQALISATARNILETQGFDMSGHQLDYTEMWVQQFADRGGGHHETQALMFYLYTSRNKIQRYDCPSERGSRDDLLPDQQTVVPTSLCSPAHAQTHQNLDFQVYF